MKILIGGAWPNANGPLHLGHIASLLPGDVLARYHRARGDTVYFVSGSDCFGTPITIAARQEGCTAREISDRYHAEIERCFAQYGFSFDYYGKTDSAEHMSFVREFHKRLYAGDYVYEKQTRLAYCPCCETALTDRMVAGLCPHCGKHARGEQCAACGEVLEAEQLLHPVCSVCGTAAQFRETTQLFLGISALQGQLDALLRLHPEWRKNARDFTHRYLREGLRDRALTRDFSWGIPVPKEGYENKRVYVWMENVLGYLSMSKALCAKRRESFSALWSSQANVRHYYVHGKDNIPFHTIILPALLLAHGENWRLPDRIVSGEHLTLEGRCISTSGNWAVWAAQAAQCYEPDSLRYYLLANGPEKRDADFSWREFVHSHNGELLGAYGNFVNRSLLFIYKYWGGTIPEGKVTRELRNTIGRLYISTGELLESGRCKDALDALFAFVRESNRYFDTQQPWLTRESDPSACADALFCCVQRVANLCVLLEPFLPFSSAKIRRFLPIGEGWQPQWISPGTAITKPELLLTRLDINVIEQETAKLHGD